MLKMVSGDKKVRRDNLIRGLPFFASLSEEEFDEMSVLLKEKHYPKGELILSEEETYRYMYIILSGSVKAVHFSPDGKEHILAMHKRGDFFGEMALLDCKTEPATVIALEDSQVVLISKEDFDRRFMENRKIWAQIMSILCSRLRESWMMLKILSLPEAEQRVRAALTMIGMRNGVRDARGTIIAVKLTHQDIADYSSVSRETVTRLINRFIRDGEISILDDRNILLKPSFTSHPS